MVVFLTGNKAVVRETASSIARKKAIASASGIKSPGSSVASVSTTSSFAAAKSKNLVRYLHSTNFLCLLVINLMCFSEF